MTFFFDSYFIQRAKKINVDKISTSWLVRVDNSSSIDCSIVSLKKREKTVFHFILAWIFIKENFENELFAKNFYPRDPKKIQFSLEKTNYFLVQRKSKKWNFQFYRIIQKVKVTFRYEKRKKKMDFSSDPWFTQQVTCENWSCLIFLYFRKKKTINFGIQSTSKSKSGAREEKIMSAAC